MHVFLLMYFSVFECPVVFDHDDIICMRKQLCFIDIERIFADVIVITCINLCVSNK